VKHPAYITVTNLHTSMQQFQRSKLCNLSHTRVPIYVEGEQPHAYYNYPKILMALLEIPKCSI